MSAQNAIYCFNENIQLFSNSLAEPEKYNLYRGLGELADAIRKLSNEIDAIKHVINHIQSQVSKQC
jgi:seryl-tRNA synthetase